LRPGSNPDILGGASLSRDVDAIACDFVIPLVELL